MQANTFSIAARCPRTGMLGVAVSTAVPAVGSLCPHVRSGAGAISTQAWVNPYLSIEALGCSLAGDPRRRRWTRYSQPTRRRMCAKSAS